MNLEEALKESKINAATTTCNSYDIYVEGDEKNPSLYTISFYIGFLCVWEKGDPVSLSDVHKKLAEANIPSNASFSPLEDMPDAV